MARVRFLDSLHNLLRSVLAPLDRVAAFVPDGASVLELGCGQGLILKSLASRGVHVVGIDFDERKCEMAREILSDFPAAQVIQADVFAYLEALAPNVFDYFILSDTLSSFSVADQDRLLRLAVSRLGTRGALVLCFIDAAAGWKTRISYAISTLTCGLRVSRSAGQKFAYQSSPILRGKLLTNGCSVDVYSLHSYPPRLLPHVVLVATHRRATIPSVTFAVLNFRVGGQVSALQALAGRLVSEGIAVKWALPDGCRSAAKEDVDEYSRRPFVDRLVRSWKMLRRLRPSNRDEVLHVVLPSPAFASMAAVIPWPENRVVLQYEGPALRFDSQTIRAAIAEPTLILPRLVANNEIWARFSSNGSSTHLATHPTIKAQLEALRLRPNQIIENIADVGTSSDRLEQVHLDRSEGQTWVAYVGHAHHVKGVSVLADAFERAAVRQPSLNLLLALTRDGASSDVRSRFTKGPLAKRVRYVGLVDVGHVLANVDALVLPYVSALTTTLYPSLLLEADAAHCPLILSDLSEFREVLSREAATLTCVRPGDVASLADALVGTPLRGTRPWAAALRMSTPESVTKRTAELYSSLVSRV